MFCYMITCKVNGKRYIGITQKTLHKRWLGHCSGARNGSRLKFSRAIRKYSPENFDCKILYEAVDWRELLAVEKGLIAEYAPEYNVSSGGANGSWTKKQREAKSIQVKSWMEDPFVRADMSRRAKIRWSGIQKKTKKPILTDEQRKQAASKAVKAYWSDPEARAKKAEETRVRWQKPGYREMISAKISATKQGNSSIGEQTRQRYMDSAKRLAHSERMKLWWAEHKQKVQHV